MDAARWAPLGFVEDEDVEDEDFGGEAVLAAVVFGLAAVGAAVGVVAGVSAGGAAAGATAGAGAGVTGAGVTGAALMVLGAG